jgi:cobalamin biosynthesis protein CbiG
MTNPLPRAAWEHLLTGVLVLLINWGGSDVIPALKNQPGPWAVVAVLLAGILQAINPKVTSFGIGSGRHIAGRGN